MSSKKIFLRRKELNNHLPKEVQAESVMKLSSVFVNRQPLKAFDVEDEEKYLKGILDVNPDHSDWPKHSKKFWAELTVPVGFTGVELEIGTDSKGNPISIIDFIKYRFALKHPHVALTKEEMLSDYGKRFYIQDLSREDTTKNNEIQVLKDADKEFIKLSSDVAGMKRVLRMLSTVNPDTLSREQVENNLYALKAAEPKKFLKIATDKHLETKSEVQAMVTAGVLRRIGNQVIFIDEVIGETLDDAVIYMKNKKNSGSLTIMRAKLKELAL